jgi:hypothetical protein
VRVSESQAIEGALGWGRGRIHLHGHYLLDSLAITSERSFDLSFVYGIGGRVTAGAGDAGLGVRAPAGLVMDLKRVPFDAFVQVALVLQLIPATSAGLDATLGARYFFED